MADWQKIKTEYITTDTSYRKLAQKHGVHYNAIANQAKKEDWISQRKKFCDRTVTKTVTKISDRKADRTAKLLDVSDLLLDKVRQLLSTDDVIALDTQGMKHISGVLKDLKEIQMIRSDADLREQEARIRNLEKQVENNDDTGREIVVRIEGSDLNGYSC